MTITIAEVIEQCAKVCDDRGIQFHPYSPHRVELLNAAEAIRALAAQYEGCIVAERAAVAWSYKSDPWFDGSNWHETHELTSDKQLAEWKSVGEADPLYRAREAK